MRTDARANREAVVEAARCTFALEGFGTPLARVAQRAGVSRTTVFRHFPTREDLVAAVYEANVDLVVARAGELAGTPDAVRTLFRLVIDIQAEFRTLLPIVDHIGFAETERLVRRVRAAFEDLIAAEAPESGDLQPGVGVDDLLLGVQMLSALMDPVYPDQDASQRRGSELLERSLFRPTA